MKMVWGVERVIWHLLMVISIGCYKGDKCHGKGSYTWTDGTKYTGDWKDGNRHGNGIIFISSILEVGFLYLEIIFKF